MGVANGAELEALGACFRAHQAAVNGLVYDRCGDVALAEEITAQTFEAAAVRFAQGGGGDVTLAWLTVVARRRLVDHWRHVAARKRALSRIAGRRETVPAADATDAAHDSDELAAALDALPPRQRTVLTLRYVDDWSVGQIADGLAISYLAAESLLARARRSFTAALDPGRSGTAYRAGRSKSRRIR